MYALIKTSCFAVWNAEDTNRPKAAHYKHIFQTIENSTCGPRSCDSHILFRLQTGHNSLNFHLHRIGLHADGLCKECRSPETVTHFLLQCPKYTYQRSKLKRATHKLHIDFNLQSLLRSEAAAARVLAFVHDTQINLKNTLSSGLTLQNSIVVQRQKTHNNNNNNSSFVPGGCCVTLQMLMRAGVLSSIKPGERFRSSQGSVVTIYSTKK